MADAASPEVSQDQAAALRDAIALHGAVSKNDLEALRALTEGKGDLAGRVGGDTALHRAAHMNRIEAALVLIGAGAPLDSKTEAGLTALSLSLAVGHNKLAKILLGAGADTGVLDRHGKNMLEITSASGNTEGMKLLYSRLPPDALLEEARRVIEDENQAALEALVESGASLTGRNSRGRTILEEADLAMQFEMAAYIQGKIESLPDEAAQTMRDGAARDVRPLKPFTLRPRR